MRKNNRRGKKNKGVVLLWANHPWAYSNVSLPLHLLCVPTEVNSATKLRMYIHIYTHTHVCVRAKRLQLCPTLCDPMDHSLPGSSRQEYWSGLPCPPPRHLPNPGTKLVSLTSPALAGGFFTTSTIWEAPHLYMVIYMYVCVYIHIHIYMYHYILIVYFLACLSY